MSDETRCFICLVTGRLLVNKVGLPVAFLKAAVKIFASEGEKEHFYKVLYKEASNSAGDRLSVDN